jgi:uncharacterized protein YbjT (DUF2867 family)
MPDLLITGATGNVGRAVLEALRREPGFGTAFTVTAGVRGSAPDWLSPAGGVAVQPFDFTDSATFAPALRPGQVVFLLRPPQLSRTAPFVDFVNAARRAGVAFVVFLSVQGVERSSVIPHHKIEQLLIASGLPYCFLRPGYFMQNLTTTLGEDLRRGTLFLPAGQAPFNWVDVADIGRAAARVLLHPTVHRQARYDLTGPANYSFPQVVGLINERLPTQIRYESPNLLRFFWRKHRAGYPAAYTLVLTLLHYLPRFQAPPPLSDALAQLTGQPPTPLGTFIETELRAFLTA